MNALYQLDFDATLSNMLYGNTEYSYEKNCKAFEKIQAYIQSTGRFD